MYNKQLSIHLFNLKEIAWQFITNHQFYTYYVFKRNIEHFFPSLSPSLPPFRFHLLPSIDSMTLLHNRLLHIADAQLPIITFTTL